MRERARSERRGLRADESAARGGSNAGSWRRRERRGGGECGARNEGGHERIHASGIVPVQQSQKTAGESDGANDSKSTVYDK